MSAVKHMACLQKRVVVTGMGVVSPVGNDLESFFGNLCAGKSGISAIESFECEGWPTRIAGEVKDFDPGDLISKKMARRLDRSIKFSLYAGKMALLDAGLPVEMKEYALIAPSLHLSLWSAALCGGAHLDVWSVSDVNRSILLG